VKKGLLMHFYRTTWTIREIGDRENRKKVSCHLIVMLLEIPRDWTLARGGLGNINKVTKQKQNKK